MAGSHQENLDGSFSEYCFHVPEIFGELVRVPVWIQQEFSGKFEVPAGSGIANHRPGYLYRRLTPTIVHLELSDDFIEVHIKERKFMGPA
jgi:hypothetical protein